MTDTERKALALVNEVLADWGVMKNAVEIPKNTDAFACALVRAIEQHEAFQQEVSDAVVKATHTMAAGKLFEASGILAALIIAKPDPLVEVLDEVRRNRPHYAAEDMASDFRAAIEKRGGKIIFNEEQN